MAKIHYFNYPVETPEAERFWASEHKCNIAKAYIAFSKDQEDFNNQMRRAGYSYQWRKRCWANLGPYVNDPSMVGIPFSEFEDRYWTCLEQAECIDWDYLVTEVEGITIATHNYRPILAEDSKAGCIGPPQPLPVLAWLVTEITEEDIYTEDGVQLMNENFTTSKNVP